MVMTGAVYYEGVGERGGAWSAETVRGKEGRVDSGRQI